MKTHFSISPRILSHLGEDLIKNESIALLELVKNSYDACASLCCVDFTLDSNNVLERITIRDNGFGMNLDVIKNAWLKVGTDYKYKDLKQNECGRIPLGEKGIGRLGVHKLGNKINLISKKDNFREVSLTIDWSILDDAEEIEDFEIDLIENEAPETFLNGTGVNIIIEDFKTKWDRRMLREVHRALTTLNSPFSTDNDNFRVKVDSNSNVFRGLPSFQDIKSSALYFGKCRMSGTKIVDFKYSFKPWKSLEKLDSGRRKSMAELLPLELDLVDEEKERNVINLNKNTIGDIEFELVIFEKDAQIFKYVDVEKKSIKDYLKENGGIRVYRNGIRVYDYGERDNDWLGIDLKRVSRVGGRVSNNIIIGSVLINRRDSRGLKEKTNREGFIENESYQAFVSAVNYALSLFVKERNVDKKLLTNLYKKHKVVEPVLSDIDEVVTIVESKLEPGETQSQLLMYLSRIASQYKEVKEVLIRSANAGLNLSVVIHEIEKIIDQLTGCIERKELEKAINLSEMLEKIIRSYTAMIKKSSIKQNNLSKIIYKALDNYEFRFLDHSIEIVTNHRMSKLVAKYAESEAISVLINLLDNSIFWLSYARKKNKKISIYVTDQLKGYNTIVVSDSGPGFTIPTDVAIEPFMTGKPHNIGSGLGLHIANEMMAAMNGKVMFLNENDIELPEKVRENKIDQAIIGLCFKTE